MMFRFLTMMESEELQHVKNDVKKLNDWKILKSIKKDSMGKRFSVMRYLLHL